MPKIFPSFGTTYLNDNHPLAAGNFAFVLTVSFIGRVVFPCFITSRPSDMMK